MDDLISRTWLLAEYDKRHNGPPGGARKLIEEAPSALSTNLAEVGTDCCISRQAAIDAILKLQAEDDEAYGCHIPEGFDGERAKEALEQFPSAQPEPKQRYTEEELSVFAHGISLSLLSKRSAQHWRYDEDTATEIKFLERLYDKVSADMKGGQE